MASERLVALFILGILLFSPPFLFIFDNSVTVMGIPVLYLYLFVAWAMLIVLMALVIEQLENSERKVNTKVTTNKTDNMVPDPKRKD